MRKTIRVLRIHRSIVNSKENFVQVFVVQKRLNLDRILIQITVLLHVVETESPGRVMGFLFEPLLGTVPRTPLIVATIMIMKNNALPITYSLFYRFRCLLKYALFFWPLPRSKLFGPW
jgi:hypothetical protein